MNAQAKWPAAESAAETVPDPWLEQNPAPLGSLPLRLA